MRAYIRFVLRSRDGLSEYLRFLCIVLGVLFAVHMILFAVLIAGVWRESSGEGIALLMYELFGSCACGIACVRWTDRLMRISVSAGVSRKNFLRGHFLILPGLAVLSTAAIVLVHMITDGIFHLSGNQFYCLAFELYSVKCSQYQPRIIVSDLVFIFCLVVFFYSLALLYDGFKKRFGLLAALIAVALTGFCFFPNDTLEYSDLVYILHIPLHLVRYLIYEADKWADVTQIMNFGWPEGMPEYHFWSYLLQLTALALFLYLASYGVFAKLTARLSLRGKEKEGAV